MRNIEQLKRLAGYYCLLVRMAEDEFNYLVDKEDIFDKKYKGDVRESFHAIERWINRHNGAGSIDWCVDMADSMEESRQEMFDDVYREGIGYGRESDDAAVYAHVILLERFLLEASNTWMVMSKSECRQIKRVWAALDIYYNGNVAIDRKFKPLYKQYL